MAVANYLPGLSGPKVSVSLISFKNNEEDAQAALQPAEDTAPAGHVLSWFCKPTNIHEQFDVQVAANPSYHRYHVDNCYIRNDADVVSVMEPAFTTLPTQRSFTMWYPMAPGNRKMQQSGVMKNMSVSMYTDHYFAVYALCEEEGGDTECSKWVRDVFNLVQLHSTGAYLGDADFQFRTTKYWNDENARRLMQIRKKWDPEGVICGYLDKGDNSGTQGLKNVNEWGL